jgi:hypothetical protein
MSLMVLCLKVLLALLILLNILQQHTAASMEQRSAVQKARIGASGRRPDNKAADSRWKARPVQASEQASL